MERVSGKAKLNVRIISVGHGDSDRHVEGENSFTRRTKRTAKVVNLTSQPGDSVPRHQKQEKQEQDTEHRKAFEKVFQMFVIIGMFLGIDFEHKWKTTTNIRFYVSVFQLVSIWISIIYTQFVHINNGDHLRVLEAFSICGVTTSMIQKLTGYINHRHQVLNLFFCMRKICRQTLPGSRADILTSQFTKTLGFLIIFPIGAMFCFTFFLACPMKAYFVDKELISLIPLEIIYIDQSTYSGFIVANAIMLVWGLYSGVALTIYGSAFIFAIFMYSLKVGLIEQDLKDLDEMWANKVIVSRAYKHAYLRNICQKRQDLNTFMSEIKDIFETKLFFYFVFNYFAQIICLFEVTKNQWTPGYAIALVSFIEMMFYCYMGTKITIAVVKSIYSYYTIMTELL